MSGRPLARRLGWHRLMLAMLLAYAGSAAPGQVAATAAAQAEQAAVSWLQAQLGPEGEFAVQPLDPRLRLKPCAALPQVRLGPGSRLAAHTTLEVHCGAGPQHWRLYLQAETIRHVQVPVTRRALAQGHLLTQDDLRPERLALQQAQEVEVDMAALIGRRLARPLAAGQPVPPGALGVEYAVRQGEEVVLLAGRVGTRIRTVGLALANARTGQRVQVRNTRSGRIVEGIARQQGVVEILL
jgi:flagella basal body P-ring formation protein FlgA